MQMIRRFTRNTAGRDLLVGDIHGNFGKLQRALDAAGFNPERDRLFAVGDLVDRGPDSAEALAWLERPWFFALCGNHELMAMLYGAHGSAGMDRNVYAYNGGAWFIGMTPAERQPYLDWFRGLPLAIELETEAGLLGLVHAECPFSDWAALRAVLETGGSGPAELQETVNSLLWGRDRAEHMDTTEVEGVRAVVVWHTPVERVTSLGNVHFIDTGAWLPQNRARPFALVDAATLEVVKP